MKLMTLTSILLVLSFLIVPSTYADCKRDKLGDVYCGKGKCEQDKTGKVFCTKYQFGDAIKDTSGKVVCGKGQCIAGLNVNDYFCSTIDGGGANVDRLGTVKCYGGCEKASPIMCESKRGY